MLHEISRQSHDASTPAGHANWLSGNMLPNGVFYDPVSLAFQVPIRSISDSHKLHVEFDWGQGQLRAVHSKFEDNHTGMNMLSAISTGMATANGGSAVMMTQGTDRETRDIFFRYYESTPSQVLQVTSDHSEFHGGLTKTAVQGASMANGVYVAPNSASVHEQDEESHDSSQGFLTLINNPKIDPVAVQQGLARRITTGFSGNSFFNPFVWDGIHIFDLIYDNQGRVVQALEHRKGAIPLRFTWNGDLLQKVVQRSGANEFYSRSLQYADGRLVSERIRFANRESQINYQYDAQGRLTAAECGTDPSLDGRSRRVVFLN
jgi:YD repeat-containing protein